MKRQKKRNRKIGYLCIIILIVITMIFTISKCSVKNDIPPEAAYNSASNVNNMIKNFAKDLGLQANAYPEKLIELLKKNPETKDYVLNYPIKKDMIFKINLNEYKNSKKVPLLMQWDERWGYSQYAGDLMGLTGCGPTCLSMVSIYLLNDIKYSPKYIAEFSERNGYSVSGNGSSWSLISEGGKKLGLDITEIPLDENRIVKNLSVGNPIICVMGPGDFTTTGHFIVMTEYVDGKIKINDPNSKTRSEKLWFLSDIKHQIRNLWVCRK